MLLPKRILVGMVAPCLSCQKEPYISFLLFSSPHNGNFTPWPARAEFRGKLPAAALRLGDTIIPLVRAWAYKLHNPTAVDGGFFAAFAVTFCELLLTLLNGTRAFVC